MTATVLSMFAAILLMQGGLAVRSGAWLGVLLVALWLVAVGCWLMGLRELLAAGKILAKHHPDLYGRKRNKNRCEPVKPPRQPQHGNRVILCPLNGNLGPLREGDLQLSNVILHPKRIGFFANGFAKLLKPCLNLYWIELVLERAHTPNDPSSATGGKRQTGREKGEQ